MMDAWRPTRCTCTNARRLVNCRGKSLPLEGKPKSGGEKAISYPKPHSEQQESEGFPWIRNFFRNMPILL